MSTSSTPAASLKFHSTVTHTPTTTPHKPPQHSSATAKPTAGSLRAAAVSEKQQKRQAQANDSQRSKKRQKRQDQRNTYKVAVDSPYHVSITAVAPEQTELVLQLLQQHFKQLEAKLSAVRKQITSARHAADLQQQAEEGAAIRALKADKATNASNAITIDVDKPNVDASAVTPTAAVTATKTKQHKMEQRLARKQRQKAQKHAVQQLVAAELGAARGSGVLLGLNEVTSALTQLQQQLLQNKGKPAIAAEPGSDIDAQRLACIVVATQNLPTALLQHLPVQCCLTQTRLLPLACTSERLGELLGLHRCIAVGPTAGSTASMQQSADAMAGIVKHATIPDIPWLMAAASAPDSGANYLAGELVEQYPKR